MRSDVSSQLSVVLAAVLLQAPLVVSLAEERTVGTVKVSDDGKCQISIPRLAPNRQEKSIYTWTDADGNVVIGDEIPSDAKYRYKRLNEHGVTIEEIEGKNTEVQIAQELQTRADLALLNENPEIEGRLSPQRGSRAESLSGQRRSRELIIEGLQRRLALLESADYMPECEELLRQEIRETRDAIKQSQESLDRLQEIYEHIQDGPEPRNDGQEESRMGRAK